MHLTGPHEWDPLVLGYTHPSGDGEPPWSNGPDEGFAFDPNFDEFGITPKGQSKLSVFWITHPSHLIQFTLKQQLFLVIAQMTACAIKVERYKTTQQSNNCCKILTGSPFQGF